MGKGTGKRGRQRARVGARRQPATRPRGEQRRPRVKEQRPEQRATARSGPGLSRYEVGFAAAVGAASALIFLATFSGQVAFGDSPESVAGVRTLGVLHAPGYPAYVLLARAFATVFPFGSWALRVNLFSLVCSALTIAVVYLIARRLGASIAGAVVGSLALATATSFWFNAGFAKHYALSGALVATSALFVLVWERGGHSALLPLAALLLGVCMGASWELAVIMLIGLVAYVWFGERRPTWSVALVSAGTFAVLTVAGWVFLLVRGSQDPTLNWGDVHNVARLVDVLTQRDFRLGTSSTTSGKSVLGKVPTRAVSYVGILARDVGLGAVLVAIVGAFGVYRRSGRATAAFLATVGVLNIFAVIFFAGIEHVTGFDSGLIAGGFLIDALIVIAVLAALGTTELGDAGARWIASKPDNKERKYRLTAAQARTFAAVVVAVAVLPPSLIVHHRYANHRIPGFADRYAERVFASLPPHAVLVFGGFGYGVPMIYRQLVHHDRPDVTLVDGGTLVDRAWAREQLTRRLRSGSTLRNAPGLTPLSRLIDRLRSTRPVFLDTTGMGIFRDAVGYRAHGLVGEVVDGTGSHPTTRLDRIAAALRKEDVEDGVATRRYASFPNATVYLLYQRAHVELAKQYFAAHRMDRVQAELERALEMYPSDRATATALDLMRRHDPSLNDYIKTL